MTSTRCRRRTRGAVPGCVLTAVALLALLLAEAGLDAPPASAVPIVAATKTTKARATKTTRRATKTTTRTTVAPTTTRPRVTPTPWRLPDSTRSYAETLQAFVTDIERFWNREFPEVYGTVPPGGLRIIAARPDTAIPLCGRERPTWDDVSGNAFYCPQGDYIAFDDEELFPALVNRYGDVALGVTLAHEVGHAMQVRAGISGSSVLIELQADCFAGAWLGEAASGEGNVGVERAELDNALSAVLSFRDRPGISAGRRGAHGNGFDRVNALQLGFEGGVSRSADFENNPPTPTAESFQSVDDLINGGNSSYGQTLEFTQQALTRYWSEAIASLELPQTVQPVDAAGYVAFNESCPDAARIGEILSLCPARPDHAAEVVLNDEQARRVHARFGDFALSTAIADAWSIFIQRRLPEVTGKLTDASLGAACLTGGWIAAADKNLLGVTLSPGDLDESVLWIVTGPEAGSPFDRVAALRQGFTGGLGGCG